MGTCLQNLFSQTSCLTKKGSSPNPPGKYPIIAVSTGLRWLTEILGWDFDSRVATTVLHQKSDSPPKVENYSIYLLFFDRGVVSVDHVTGHVIARTVL